MRFSLRTIAIVLPLLLAVAFAYYKRWYDYNYEVMNAEVEYWVTGNEEDLQAWLKDWKPYLRQCDYVAGCGCCNAVYEIRGPRRAILTFPIADNAEIGWAPKPAQRQFRYSALGN